MWGRLDSGDSRLEVPGASYFRCGTDYIVEVPIVIRGHFKEKDFQGIKMDMLDSCSLEWFEPPGSTLIPYSEVIRLREAQLGNQLSFRTIVRPGRDQVKSWQDFKDFLKPDLR